MVKNNFGAKDSALGTRPKIKNLEFLIAYIIFYLTNHVQQKCFKIIENSSEGVNSLGMLVKKPFCLAQLKLKGLFYNDKQD